MNIGIDMVQFMVFTIILAVIAAVIDLTITISSPIYELHQVNPTLTQYELFQSGMRVGREILATSANTIYLAFFGGQLALFIWFFKLKYSFGHIIRLENICPRIYFYYFRRYCRCNQYSDYGLDYGIFNKKTISTAQK